MFPEGKLVKRGTFLYAGEVVCDVCIRQTDIRYGSGDYEDPPDIQDDLPGEWFDVWYTPAGARGNYRNCNLGFATLAEAPAYVKLGFANTQWAE